MRNAAKTVKTSAWKEYNLGELLTLINGRAYRKAEERESGTPVLRIQNLNKGDRWFYSDLELPDDKYCEKGDLLFAWSATFGPYIWWGEKVIYHYHIWKIECSPKLDKKFAYYLLQHITEKVKSAGRGISMLHMTKSGMEAWKVSVPSVSEQKRIAAILDQADALRQSRQKSLELLDEQKLSVFMEMFGNPLQENEHESKPLGKCVKLINGRAYKKSEEREEGTPVLRIQNLNGGDRWFYSDLSLPEDKYAEKGDLLFAWSATFGPYIWWGEKVIYHYHIWKIECGPEIEKLYMYWLLKVLSGDVKRSGRGISMTHATKGGMEERLIPVPDINLQLKFSEKIKFIEALEENFRMQLDALNDLFFSLQQRAFRGEL